MNKLTEEQKLNYFQSLHRDDAIEFWQILKINTEATLTDILLAYNKEYAREDLEEVSKYKFDQMRYNTTTESFTDFLTKYKIKQLNKHTKRTSDIGETFLLAKFPIQIQNELTMAGKHDATVEERRSSIAVANTPNYSLAPLVSNH